MRALIIGLFFFIIAIFSSCSVTRRVPDGQYLLMNNSVRVAKERDLPRVDRITPSELEPFIRQQPTPKFLGTNVPLWFYNQADPDKHNWWNNLKRRIGSEPVYLDTLQTQKSAENMKIYMDGKGFLDSKVAYFVDTMSTKKARVAYLAFQGIPYRIGNVSYDFKDDFLKSIVMSDSSSTLLKTGNVFDTEVLDNERVRITEFLKNRGYYNFNINNISYIADSTVGNKTVDLTLVVKRYMSGYDEQGQPVMDNNKIYRLRNIYINPNFNPTVAASDSLYSGSLDTLEFNGLHIVYNNRLNVRPEILRRTINLYPNYLYSEEGVKRTYDNIMRLGYYRSASILFTERPTDTTSTDNLVTFIGDMNNLDSVSYTQEGYLDCHILCTPALRQSYSIDLEGTTSTDYFGLTAKVGYQNRNLFRGVELFDISVHGGYEFMRHEGRRNSFEVGGAVSFSFPRFITPFKVDRYNRTFNPRTRAELSYSVQRRPYYHRMLFSGTWGYSWGDGKRSSFMLRPIDISLVKLRDVDQDFLNSIQNPYLKNSYTSQLIAGLSGYYIYSDQVKNLDKSTFALRLNFETNGNLINGLTHLIDRSKSDYKTLFNIRYAQYFRLDANFSKRFVLGPKTSLVYRLYSGWGYAYGNSTSIPFERLFYAGGSNSMRGWLPRTLGPGNQAKPTDVVFPSQLGNFKLETNLEFRFPVWGLLQGATFFDVGNIWFLGQGANNPDETFRFKTFIPQLGFNTGLGARFDFNFFIFRVDWGIKLHSPNEPAGQRWIHNFQIRNTTLNFGVGYPF